MIGTPAFDDQLMRAMALTYYKGADIGECIAIAEKIEPGNRQSWHEQWLYQAERLSCLAEQWEKEGLKQSSEEAYLRASNYYRSASFFLYGSPDKETALKNCYVKHVETFEKGMRPLRFKKIAIPYEKADLKGYFFSKTDEEKPVVILNTGYDGTCQECFMSIGLSALERGFHVLCFDGPGQGHALIKQSLPLRPDWEHVIKPIIDFCSVLPACDLSKIVLIGQSFGGYLAPRAACFEKRLAALIAIPGQFDVFSIAKGKLG
ncbi:MAG: esterase FrsA [Parachlamydia sp.]|nr:esterase FrsA [Parachlamydia sp.]